MNTTAIARYALLVGGLCAGCHRTNPGASDEGRACLTHKCEILSERMAGDFPQLIKGASFKIRDFRPFCRLDVSWPVSTASVPHFHAMVDAQEAEVLPLPLGLVQVSVCRGLETPAPTSRPYAILVLDPDVAALPALEPNDVFIPLAGDAALDETFYASAHIEPAPDGAHTPPSVRIAARSRSSRPEEGDYEGLHEGDSFGWGPTKARIVRIVPVADRRLVPVGWVEVSLSPRSAPAQN